MSYELLRQELKERRIRNLYLFYGKEEYMIAHCAREIEKTVVDPRFRDVSYSLFEEKAEPGALYDACNSYPLSGGRRLVVLKNCGVFKQAAAPKGGAARRKKGKAAGAGTNAKSASDVGAGVIGAAREAEAKPGGGLDAKPGGEGGIEAADRDTADSGVSSLNSLIGSLPDFVCLLIIESEADKRHALFKQIGEKGLIAEFPLRQAYELEKWVMNIAGREGRLFARDALRLFMEYAGDTMTDIKSELDKLLTYTAGKQGVTIEDVSELFTASIKAGIFNFLDSVVYGDKKQALSGLESLLREREPPMKIFAQLTGHLVLLRQLKGFAEGGVRLSEATGIIGIHQYRAEKIWRQCSGLSAAAITRAVELCYENDKAIKSGKIGDEAALRLLVATLSMR